MSKPHSLLNTYGITAMVTLAVLVIVTLTQGQASLIPVLTLAIIEITFSFENAVINSQVLSRLNRFWQTMFLTVGIAIAVFGVRLILPLILVSASTAQNLGGVLNLALNNPDEYARELHTAYPLIAAFGGVFLLMIGLRFFGERRDVRWLDTIEAPLGAFNQPWWVVVSGALGTVTIIYTFLAPGQTKVAVAGLLGAATFLVIKGVGELLIHRGEHQKTGILHGRAALSQFIYLELLDASFSFDGVIGAFAITKDVVLIATGLGIGALFVRSITIHLLRTNTLAQYRYLVHGAHYAIGSLAVILLLGIRFHIPEFITGFIGLLFIGAALQSSRNINRQQA